MSDTWRFIIFMTLLIVPSMLLPVVVEAA